MQTRTLIWLAVLVPLAGCVTESNYSKDGANDAAVAQMRGEMTALDGRVSAVDGNVQSLQTQLAGIARENAALTASIKDQQDSVKQTMASLAANQRAELDKAARTITSVSAQSMDQMTKQMAEMPRVLQDLHKKTTADLATLQKDVLALQAQINAYASRIERLEQHDRAGGASGSSSPSSSSPSPSGSSAGTKASSSSSSSIVRTGTPSHPDIDYTKVYKHTVASGETLWKIAKLYEVEVQDIYNVNTNLNKNLSLGQQLYIPYRKKAEQSEK